MTRHKTTTSDGWKAGESDLESESGCAIGARKNGFAEAGAFLLQPVEQPPRPHELGGQNSEREENGDPTGTRSEYHCEANCEQREAEHNPQDPLGLMNGPYEHLGPVSKMMREKLRAPHENVPARGLPTSCALAERLCGADNGLRLARLSKLFRPIPIVEISSKRRMKKWSF
jgi:hypothetical protein